MKTRQSGFATIEAFLLLVIFAMVFAAGWYVYLSSKNVTAVLDNSLSSGQAESQGSKKSFKVVAVGDIACDPSDEDFSGNDAENCQSASTYKIAKQVGPDAVLALGDLQYNNGKYEKFMGSYDKSWGLLKAITYPVPGNHEYADNGAAGYNKYFSDGIVGDKDKGYYSVKQGNWKIIALNSNCEFVGGCEDGTAQTLWLKQELSKSKNMCTILFWHHPHFTSGKYSNDSKSKNLSSIFWQLLTEADSDIVLNGHDHLYERFAPQDAAGLADKNGARQFTVGTGGKSLYKTTNVQPTSQRIIDDQFGILELELYSKAYRWKYISTANQVLDSGYDSCGTSR